MEKDKLEKHEVMQYLREYNEQEIFYLQYQQKKQDYQSLQLFLKDYDKHNLMYKQIYIEEFLQKGQNEFEPRARTSSLNSVLSGSGQFELACLLEDRLRCGEI
ncbi:hypothetical protein BSAF29S_05966 [Bacillus safensis subsp. safensis]